MKQFLVEMSAALFVAALMVFSYVVGLSNSKAQRIIETRTIVKPCGQATQRVVTDVKIVKVPVTTVVHDHTIPRSFTRDYYRLQHQVWVDRQNLATANLR